MVYFDVTKYARKYPDVFATRLSLLDGLKKILLPEICVSLRNLGTNYSEANNRGCAILVASMAKFW